MKKMDHELRSRIDKYEKMTKRMGALSSVDQLVTRTYLPYSVVVMAAPWPPKFRVPQIEMYDGSKVPLEHLETFKTHMTLHEFPREVDCRVFLLTMKEAARGWSGSL